MEIPIELLEFDSAKRITWFREARTQLEELESGDGNAENTVKNFQQRTEEEVETYEKL